MKLSFLCLCGCGVMGIFSPLTRAEPLQEALQTQLEIQQEAVSTQQQVTHLDDERLTMLHTYTETLKQIEQLRQHNRQLQRVIEQQTAQQLDLQQQSEHLTDTRTQLEPLLEPMFEALKAFVRLDVPFLNSERAQRLQTLRSTLDDPALSLADKYQPLWQAYQVEMGYGYDVDTYTGALTVGERAGQQVQFLRLGRVALYYLGLDGRSAGAWDQAAQQWRVLPPADQSTLHTAIRIAKGQAAPQLLALPLPPALLSSPQH